MIRMATASTMSSISLIAAVLGWSPITRALLRRKRKSRPLLDEVEDGGRAAVIEEGVAALAFDYARRHHMLEGVNMLDFQLLRTIKDMTSHLEVSQCTTGDWERQSCRASRCGAPSWPHAAGGSRSISTSAA